MGERCATDLWVLSICICCQKSSILAFGSLIILIPLLSMRHIEIGDKQINAVVFALSMLACLGIPNKSLIGIGLILPSLAFYTFRKRLELQYIVSYVILWTFVNQVYKVDYLVLGMRFLFGFAVFVMIHYTTKRTLALLKKGYDGDSGDRNPY